MFAICPQGEMTSMNLARPRFRSPVLPGPKLLLGLALAAAAMGCSSDVAVRRSVTRQLGAATKEMADLLETVKDKPTAEAARPKVQALVKRVDRLTEELDSMEESVGVGDEKLLAEMGDWIAENTRMMREQYRIAQLPEARAGLGDTWMQLTGGAYDPGGVFGPGGKMDMGPIMNPAMNPAGIQPPAVPAK
jgi:hypothetical protein